MFYHLDITPEIIMYSNKVKLVAGYNKDTPTTPPLPHPLLLDERTDNK